MWKLLRLSLLLSLSTASAGLLAAHASNSQALHNGDFLPLSKIAGDDSLKTAEGREFPFMRVEAKSANGRLVEPRFRFLVEGGLHGNEHLASAFVAWLAKRYASGQGALVELGPDRVAFDFLPFANPDGALHDTRDNARGVNLNRNFGVLWGVTRENPGPTSFSEPETRAIRYLFSTRHYTAAVDVHGYINWLVTPSDPATLKEEGRPAGDLSQQQLYSRWITTVRSLAPMLPDHVVKTAGGLGDGGAFEDWAFWNQNTLAFCLELSSPERFDQANDVFPRYEAFLAKAFRHAMALKEELRTTKTSTVLNIKPSHKATATSPDAKKATH